MISCHCELKSKDNWGWQFQQAVIWRGGRKRESAAEQVTRRRLNLEYVDSVLNVERQTCSRENLDAWQHAWQHDGPQAHVSSISAFFSVHFHRKTYFGLGPFSDCYIDSFELLYCYYYYFANMFDFGAIDPIEISVANFNFRIWSNQGNHVSIYIYIYNWLLKYILQSYPSL